MPFMVITANNHQVFNKEENIKNRLYAACLAQSESMAYSLYINNTVSQSRCFPSLIA